MKNNLKTKQTAFRSWKSGKTWLFSASVLTVLAGGVIATESAHADTLTNAYVLEASLVASSATASQPTTAQSSILTSQADSSANSLTAASTTSLVSNISAALDTVASSATSTVSSVLASSVAVTSSTATIVSKDLASINLSSYVSDAGSLYNLTLGSAISQVIQTVGVSGTVTLLSEAVTAVAGFTSAIPGVNSLVSTAQGLISAVVTAESYAAMFGLTPDVINGTVANILTTGLTTLGAAANTALAPVLQQIPVVGSALSSFISPILANPTNISIAGLVSDVATATGTSGILNTIQSTVSAVTPTIVAAGQTVIDTLTGIYNFVAPILNSLGITSAINNLINNYVIAPITNLINGVTGQSTTGAVAGTSSSSASSSAVSNSSSSAASSSVASGTPNTVVTKDLTISKGGTFNAVSGLINAYDSTGSAVSASAISVIGKVNTRVLGQYVVIYRYTDATTKQVYSNTTTVTVNDPTAVTSAQASLASLNAQMTALSAVSISSPTASLTSTTNWPSSQTVILPAPSSAFVPDVNQINSYYMSYVNELRSANGLSAASYSSSMQAVAQSRAAQIVTDFSHDGTNISAENIAGSGSLVSKMQSNQEIAYYMVMDWYDETDNPEAVGAGHYGHRANLLYSGPQTAVGMVFLPTPDSAGYDEYSAMESVYTQQSVVDQATAMANSATNPNTIPLPKLTFKYVDAAAYTTLQNQISALKASAGLTTV